MNVSRIYILMCFVVFSITKVCGFDKVDSLYKISKIKTIRIYYVIHAQRNDSSFKIVSKRVDLENPHFEVLKKGKYYNFNFGKEDNDTTKVKAEPLVGSANYLDVKRSLFWGDTKIKFTNAFTIAYILLKF